MTTGPRQGRQPDGPELIVLYPTALKQWKEQISEPVANAKPGRVQPPRKLGRFAQDACLYFVLAPEGPTAKPRFVSLFLNF